MSGQTALRVLRRRWLVVLGAVVVVVGLTVARGLSEPKLYVSSASLLFRDPGFDEKLFGTTFFAPSDDPEREAQTNIELVSLDVVAERTAAALGGAYEAEDVSDKVSIAGGGGSNVITVDASDTVATESARIANTFANEYIEFRRDADRSKIQDAQALVRSQLSQVSADGVGPAARTLRDRLDQLDVLASLQTGNAELVQEARPATTTSSPGAVGTTVRGLLLGLLLAGVLVLLIERLDRRLHDPEEAAAILGRPLLGAIAPARGKLRPGELSAKESEAFHMLRANLRYLSIDREIRSIVVTSGAPGDGKTTVAWNLALAAASAGTDVVLVEADLRNPALGARVDLGTAGHSGGLSEVLAGEVSLDHALVHFGVRQGSTELAQGLDLLPAGGVPPNPADLAESARMQEVLVELRDRYELVIIDTPPVTVISDTIPLLTKVDGVLVVVRMKKSTRDQTLAVRRQLDRVDASLLGVVANYVSDIDHRYGYGEYGYSGHPVAGVTAHIVVRPASEPSHI